MLGMYDNALDAIGQTPLIRLSRVAERLPCPVYGKIEFFNPGGSIKDRIGKAMIEKAERDGIIKPGVTTIIEPTSGNTGVGLAMVAAIKGYRCIFVMPDKMSAEKTALLQAYGGEVVIVPTNVAPDSPESYAGVAKRLLNEIPNAWQPNQFTNLANPEIHYLTTGPEIWQQTHGKVTVYVAGIGTGGTISGVGKYLKERNPNIRIIGADPEGSVLSGGTPGPWKVEGIGEDYVPKTFNSQVVDDWVRVSDKESFSVARKIARLEGLLVGGSCGTAAAAALRYAERCTPRDLVVALFPDTGRNYLSKLYNDEWMRQNGFFDDGTRPATAGDLVAAQGERELMCLSPNQTMQDAIDLFRLQSISQIPIIEQERSVGGIQEVTLARLLHEGRNPRAVRLGDIMARPFPEVGEHITLDEVYRLLMSGNTGVLVRQDGKVRGIITRIDLVNFWDTAATAAAKA
ncbi:putative cystathionine beta-synthase [Phycisphaerae bacterium RAS1]|nr:putative cystathionine beta-synthase [Phycisphaerae bacterium RAS1]